MNKKRKVCRMIFKSHPITVEEIFSTHWRIWKFLGAVPNQNYLKLHRFYTIMLTLIFIIDYPLHLVLGLMDLVTIEEFCLNLTITVPSVVCVLKFYNFWRNLNKVRELEIMFNILHSRISQQSEWMYYREVAVPTAMRILHAFHFLCIAAVAIWELSILITGCLYGWRLMNLGYFPFDEYATTLNFIIANIFQLIGFSVHVKENLASDTYGGMCLALLSGHAHLLGKRVASIGYDESKTQEENTKDLIKCIADHNVLFDSHRKIGEIMGFSMFVQIISASLIMGFIIISMVFYSNNILEYFTYSILLFAGIMEVFPTCYYGTYFEVELDKLTVMLYSCNWMDQSREFKKNLIIFVEQSLKERNFKVGGMFALNLNIFFSICKGVYSLLTLALQMK
ncbi:odorant receptor 33b-like [Eurosta solidaginis]|uniref:odorant receptor 33b-like n=1 Tax=Eurosta solidaginis TaxID=178769 RepID=UPI00353086E8